MAADVQKTDATTVCSNCNGTMKIQKIEPLFNEPTLMQHTFVCQGCGNEASFKFKKGGL